MKNTYRFQFFLIYFLLLPLSLLADTNIDLPKSGIKFSIPGSFEVKNSGLSQAIFIANNSETGTSINVVELASNKQIAGSRKLTQEILDSYHGVGLSSARMEDFHAVRNTLGTAVLKATVSYTSNERTHLSYVALFNGENKHFFLTMISRSRSLEDKQNFNKIVDTIEAKTSKLKEEGPDFPWFFLILGLSVAGYVYFKHFNRSEIKDPKENSSD